MKVSREKEENEEMIMSKQERKTKGKHLVKENIPLNVLVGDSLSRDIRCYLKLKGIWIHYSTRQIPQKLLCLMEYFRHK